VGYVNDSSYREKRSAGGLTTWLQRSFLEEGLADFVVSVVPNNDPDQLFRFAVLDSVDEVLRSARSAYYPVEMSGVVAEIIENPGRYVVTGLPCFLKGLRLAARHNAKLRDRIACTIGLVCGQLKSKFFAEYLIAACGVDPACVSEVDFRHKDPSRRADDYSLSLRYHTIKGAEAKGSEASIATCSPETRRAIWTWDYFKPNACNYCDDVFAEVADVVCMDAWLPEITNDWRGTNLVIARSPRVLELLGRGIEQGALAMQEISIDQVIESQAGALTEKRKWLAHRLYLDERKGQAYVPHKRIAPKRLSSPIDRWLFSCKERMRLLSRQKFAALGYDRDAVRINRFRSQMTWILLVYGGARSVDRLVRGLPRRLASAVRSLW
jgi:coenzyme F420-reducing hydrogenase beta subunit